MVFLARFALSVAWRVIGTLFYTDEYWNLGCKCN